MLFGKVLSETQIEQIRNATEDVLETVGMKVEHDEALGLLRRAGASVDEPSGIVRMPCALLRELIGRAPSELVVRGLDGVERTLGGAEQWGHAIVTDPWIVDYETQEPRRPGLDDVRRNTIIGQQLDHVAAMSCMDFPVAEVTGPDSNLHALQEHLLHHGKHNFIYATSVDSLRLWLDIGRILTRGGELRGSRLFSVAVASLSPLAIMGANVELMKIACDYDFPIIPTVCPTAGMTGPFTLAGTLVQGNAEILFMLALSQLFRPGQPFLYAFGPGVGNLQNAGCMYYTMDKVLWKAAHVQLAKSYGLPVAAECGGSMVHRFDQQSGAEGMLFMLAAVASGANLLAGFGSTYNAVGHSTEMMLVQSEYFDVARTLARGIRTDVERLGVEAIRQAQPGGQFLTDDLTLAFMRGGEFSESGLFDHSGELRQGPSLLERAHQRVTEIVQDFTSPVPEDVKEDLQRFFRRVVL
jgi:trimethylamine---corrinoid protein Co-methyltransferase